MGKQIISETDKPMSRATKMYIFGIILGCAIVLIAGIIWVPLRYPIMFATIIGAGYLKLRETRTNSFRPQTPTPPARPSLPRRPSVRRY